MAALQKTGWRDADMRLHDWEQYAETGWRILDPHLGSGSSRIAAYELGFDFVGYEIDPYYFKAQEKRFQEYVSQLSLFHRAE